MGSLDNLVEETTKPTTWQHGLTQADQDGEPSDEAFRRWHGYGFMLGQHPMAAHVAAPCRKGAGITFLSSEKAVGQESLKKAKAPISQE